MICPICDSSCSLLDTVDFNKSCLVAWETLRPELAKAHHADIARFALPSGLAVEYYLCSDCGFCYAPAICGWTEEEFRQKIYNADYAAVDPEYSEARPRENAELLIQLFAGHGPRLRHLDYGAGNGALGRELALAGWSSVSFDPIAAGHRSLEKAGQFDLVTAFEVFEHASDVRKLVEDLGRLAAADGMVLFSTQLSDDHVAPGRPLDWWYAAPRNGHISLFSSTSLAFLGSAAGFSLASFGPGLHAFWRSQPAWAAHLVTAW
jgi:SAM-dependent methyltransferase